MSLRHWIKRWTCAHYWLQTSMARAGNGDVIRSFACRKCGTERFDVVDETAP